MLNNLFRMYSQHDLVANPAQFISHCLLGQLAEDLTTFVHHLPSND